MKATIKQRDIIDCGVACLVSVAAHYNLGMPVAKIRQIAGHDRQGTNALGMVKAAEQLGFSAKGGKGTLESLSKIPLPAIAHVELMHGDTKLHHFVVIYKVTAHKIIYMDPADGVMRSVSFEEFKS